MLLYMQTIRHFLVSDGGTDSIQDKLDGLLDGLHQWFGNSNLYFNPDKTHYLVFHPRQNLNYPTFDVRIAGSPVGRQNTVTFLGVDFDDTLSFRTHCNRLIKSLNSKCYMLRNLKSIFDTSQLLTCYFGLVHSALRYGLVVWGSSTSLHDVFLAQKRIVRCIAGVSSVDSCRPLFRRYSVLPLPSLYIMELLMYIFENKDAFVTRDTIHEHNTRSKHLFNIPQKRLKLTYDTPGCLGIKLFNALPGKIREIGSKLHFKRAVKRALLSLCCYNIAEYFGGIGSC